MRWDAGQITLTTVLGNALMQFGRCIWRDGSGIKDVTDRCFMVDEELGTAGLYDLNAQGRKFFDPKTGGIAKTTWCGNFRIELKSDAPEWAIRAYQDARKTEQEGSVNSHGNSRPQA